MFVVLFGMVPTGLAVSNTVKIAAPSVSGQTQTKAILRSSVTWSGVKPGEGGFYYGKAPLIMTSAGFDTVLPNIHGIPFWYDLHTECKITLTQYTIYYCKPYVVQAGKKLGGSLPLFKTSPITANFISIQATGVNNTTAQISCYVTYKGSDNAVTNPYWGVIRPGFR